MESLTESEERIARRVAELLREDSPLLTAEQVARRSGHSRGWVYDNAEKLGAVRTGDGPRPRLRFPADCLDRLSAGSQGRRTREDKDPAPTQNRERRRHPKRQGASEYLPIRRVEPVR
jgi:hypothetical protein